MSAHREAPFLVRAIPNASRRQLAERYKLLTLFDGKEQRRYLGWVRDTEVSYRRLLGYSPTPAQLQMITSLALREEGGFLDYLLSKGITDFVAEQEKVESLADAGAALLVTRYMDGKPAGGGL